MKTYGTPTVLVNLPFSYLLHLLKLVRYPSLSSSSSMSLALTRKIHSSMFRTVCRSSSVATRRAVTPTHRNYHPLPRPTLPDKPLVTVPAENVASSSKTPLSPDAASPQTVAPPPPAPKAERPRPKIRAAKAAITLVSFIGLIKN